MKEKIQATIQATHNANETKNEQELSLFDEKELEPSLREYKSYDEIMNERIRKKGRFKK